MGLPERLTAGSGCSVALLSPLGNQHGWRSEVRVLPCMGPSQAWILAVCLCSFSLRLSVAQQNLNLSWVGHRWLQPRKCPLEGGIPVGGSARGLLWDAFSPQRSPRQSYMGGEGGLWPCSLTPHEPQTTSRCLLMWIMCPPSPLSG